VRGRRAGPTSAVAVLREVLDACSGTGRFYAVGVSGDKGAGLEGPADVVVVPDLVKGRGLAA